MCRRVLARLLMAETSVSNSPTSIPAPKTLSHSGFLYFQPPLPLPPCQSISFRGHIVCTGLFEMSKGRNSCLSACCCHWDTSLSSSLSLRCSKWSQFSFFTSPRIGTDSHSLCVPSWLGEAATRDDCLSALRGNSRRGWSDGERQCFPYCVHQLASARGDARARRFEVKLCAREPQIDSPARIRFGGWKNTLR